jgi:threonine dehydrogenase-like Zn-dependent dehydrogenase
LKGLWLENQELELRNDLPLPAASGDEALVRVDLAGICGTDLELVNGYYPFTGILGHEFVGEIVECPVDPGRVGERVVGEINASCGKCATCRAGRPRHCPNSTVLGIVGRNGCFAEYLTLPARNLLAVPETVADEEAVFTEPLAAAIHILEQVKVKSSDRVVLIGAGRLGLLIAQVLDGKGCDLKVMAKYSSQRDFLEQLAIKTVSEVPTNCADIVVEATGSCAGLELARQSVRPLGTIVLKSTYEGSSSLDFSAVVVDEVTLVGSRCGPFGPALELIERGKIVLEPLVERAVPLTDGSKAIQLAGQKGALKVLLRTSA